jgi:hypothetical protein
LVSSDSEIRRYQRSNQKIPKGESEDTKGVIRRYQRGIRRYQRGNQKIPKGDSEDTKGESEDTKGYLLITPLVSSDYSFGIF